MRSALYEGDTWHARRGPVDNEFRYRLYTWLIDLDEVDRLDRELKLFSAWRPGLCSLRADDHFIPPRKDAVVEWLGRRGVDLRRGRVELMTSPRLFGHTFNPLSLWWCWDVGGALRCVIAEVHNTYGGRHAYLLELDSSGRVEHDKKLYVSPFYEVEGRYVMRLVCPRDEFSIHIGYERAGERIFDATWRGRRRALTNASLAAVLVRYPLMTLKVIALIHLQGIRLWTRGLKVVPRRSNMEKVN